MYGNGEADWWRIIRPLLKHIKYILCKSLIHATKSSNIQLKL